MHKLAKGLKKKKKGKKSKHKEEELFKPEELEAYRREHAAASEDSAAKNEEWRNFLSLTSGVDDILKKTQDDLDRIKSTSFFQRIPTSSETKSKKALEEAQQKAQAEKDQALEEEPQLGIVQVSESESEEEEEDDIFDTAYIDAIATGEVKLAYIPESPTDKPEEDDPFDTSIAERAILGPAATRRGKKLVPLGAAVEVLTGRVQLPTCASKPASRRQILKERDLLLGSFDCVSPEASAASDPVKTLLDDDEIPLPDAPIDLSRSLYIPPAPQSGAEQTSVVKDFEEDEDDKEFEALAAESLSKSSAKSCLSQPALPAPVVADWKPFETPATDLGSQSVDPFDTTFAENILPGKAELRLIEKDILENDVDFDPRSSDSYTRLQSAVLLNTKVPESELTLITPEHRDLLGGSTSDLANLGPTLPVEDRTADKIKYCDPFDTSIVESVTAPGQAELKYLEKELLGDLTQKAPEEVDFDPRAFEHKPRAQSRPDVLNVGQSKTVSFAVPSLDLLGAEQSARVTKPLTPFYVRKNSVPGAADQDPFDTTFVPSLAPGRAEIKAIEKELSQVPEPLVEAVPEPQRPRRESADLLSASEQIAAKVLTPHASDIAEEALSYADPFDTSIATNILPGKAELKLLETELIDPRVEADSQDLLVHSGDIIIEKPLSPQLRQFSAEIEDLDPFDTSFASNIHPGKAELKVLESELI